MRLLSSEKRKKKIQMQVKILKDIFLKPEYIDQLNNLLKYFRSGKHNLIIEDYDDIEAFKNSEWFKELNPRDLKIINKYIIASTKRDKSYKLINISSLNNNDYFEPVEADKFLDQPLTILVENSEYDSLFMNVIFNFFDDSSIILESLNENWAKYGMGGGSSIVNVINSELNNSFNHHSFTKDKKIYFRIFAILDSDKKYPAMVYESQSEKKLKENSINYHVLYKREKENYVPYQILKTLNDPFFNIYVNFKDQDQKDYFDLEKGFDNKNKDKLQVEVGELYENISVDDYKVLRKGTTYEDYKNAGNFKKEFSKLFNHKKITQDMLLEVIKNQKKIGSLNEFEHIIKEIKKIL